MFWAGPFSPPAHALLSISGQSPAWSSSPLVPLPPARAPSADIGAVFFSAFFFPAWFLLLLLLSDGSGRLVSGSFSLPPSFPSPCTPYTGSFRSKVLVAVVAVGRLPRGFRRSCITGSGQIRVSRSSPLSSSILTDWPDHPDCLFVCQWAMDETDKMGCTTAGAPASTETRTERRGSAQWPSSAVASPPVRDQSPQGTIFRCLTGVLPQNKTLSLPRIRATMIVISKCVVCV
jgi:hypothetical protein